MIGTFSYNKDYKDSLLSDISAIDVNKVVVSDRVSYNKGKDWRYIVGYQNTKKNIFIYDVSQYSNNLSLCNVIQCFRGSRVGASLSKHLERG